MTFIKIVLCIFHLISSYFKEIYVHNLNISRPRWCIDQYTSKTVYYLLFCKSYNLTLPEIIPWLLKYISCIVSMNAVSFPLLKICRKKCRDMFERYFPLYLLWRSLDVTYASTGEIIIVYSVFYSFILCAYLSLSHFSQYISSNAVMNLMLAISRLKIMRGI